MNDMVDFTRVRLYWEPGSSSGLLKHTHLDFVRDGSEPTGADLLDMAEACQTSARTGAQTWASIAAAGYPLNHCSAQNMTTVGVPTSPSYPYGRKFEPTSIEIDSAGAVAPAGAATSLPPATSQLVAVKTLTPGKRFEGRLYLPGGAEADADAAGTLAVGQAGENGTFVEQLAAAVVATDVLLGWVVVSLAADAATAVDHAQGRLALATQRRRQKYLG